jgi:hypothetical protein
MRIHEQSLDQTALCVFTDEKWKWPDGFEPPVAWLRDPTKMAMIREIQEKLEASNVDFRELARRSYWDVNKRTITRYLEGKEKGEGSKCETRAYVRIFFFFIAVYALKFFLSAGGICFLLL